MTQFTRREVLSLSAALALTARSAYSAEAWVEGKHYSRIELPPVAGAKVVPIVEIFSYGCPACNMFQPSMQSLESKVPAGAVDYLPASWIAAESWPLFQRAYLTAKALGVAHKAHQAMFGAIWSTGELAVTDLKTGRLRSRQPTIEEVAVFYQRVTAVPAAKFVETAKSFGVESNMRRADAQIKAYRAGSTPTLIINGKYRFEPRSAGSEQKAIELALWLMRLG